MYTNILIATDGSELAGKAVEHGIELAKRIGAKTTALTVLPPFHVLTVDTQMLEDTPAQYKRACRSMPRKSRRRRQAAQAAGVLRDGPGRARASLPGDHRYRESKGCDLIVMASHGRHGIAALVLGSETVKVLTHSKIPVLVHR